MKIDFKQFIKREKHVAMNAQPFVFRLIKWIVIITILILLILWKGWIVAGLVFLGLALTGTCVHFFLRWKTKGWTEPWGPYKKALLKKP